MRNAVLTEEFFSWRCVFVSELFEVVSCSKGRRKMGGVYISKHITHSDTMPDPNTESKFDPMLGFPNGRKPRVMVATEDEMNAVRLKPDLRDYCAHKYLDILACKNKHFPFMHKCEAEKSAYEHCEYDDYILRMKEYERERRLLEREKRIRQQAMAA